MMSPIYKQLFSLQINLFFYSIFFAYLLHLG